MNHKEAPFLLLFKIIHPGTRPWSRRAAVTACQIKRQLEDFILDLWFLDSEPHLSNKIEIQFEWSELVLVKKGLKLQPFVSALVHCVLTRYRNYSDKSFLMLVLGYLNLKTLIALPCNLVPVQWHSELFLNHCNNILKQLFFCFC